MTLQGAIVAARRRVLRPEGYQQAPGAFIAIATSALLLQPPATVVVIDLLLFLLVGAAGFLAVFTVAWITRAKGRHLELIELGALVAMIFSNPSLRLAAGVPRIVFFMTLKVSGPRIALLFALPLLGSAAVCAMVALAGLWTDGRRKPPRRKRRPGLVLYRSHIPLRLFALTYALEHPVILTNPAVATTVRNVVLVLLGVRVVWFMAYVFRTEQEIGRLLGAPWRLVDRLPLYRPAGVLHAVLCAFPVLLYAGRVVVG